MSAADGSQVAKSEHTDWWESGWFSTLVGIGAPAAVSLVVLLTVEKPPDHLAPLVLLLGSAAAFLIITLVGKRARRSLWVRVGRGVIRFANWDRGLQWFSTERQREAIRQAGWDARDQEVTRERERSRRPNWNLRHDDGVRPGIFTLRNSGYRVDDVELNADPEFFVFVDNRPILFAGDFGDNMRGGSTGKDFDGYPTDRGKREGVTFSVTWTDQNGDRQPQTSGMHELGTLTLPPERPRTTAPTWQVQQVNGGDPRIHGLTDHSWEASQVRDVLIEADPTYFTFMAEHEWAGEVFGHRRAFAGRATEAGHNLGVAFSVSYEDANGDRLTDVALLPPGEGFYGYPGML